MPPSGTFGLISQAVAHGVREIAIRVALAAEPGRLVRDIGRRGMVTTIIGLILGGLASQLVGNAMKAMIYGVRPGDPISFVAAGATLLTMTAVGAMVPALRAARIDPASVLRGD